MKNNKDNENWFGRNNAFSYLDEDWDNRIRIRKILDFFQKEKKKQKVLDIGCGEGQISQKIKELNFAVYGLDISKKNVQIAKKRGICAKLGDVEKKFPFPNNSFDIVFAGEIIEHVYDTSLFLKEINRVLKKGGRLLLTTPNLAHLPDRIRFLFGLNPTQVQPLHEFLYLHIRPFTFNLLRESLNLHRFTIKKLTSTMVVFSRNKKNVNHVEKKSIMLAKIFPKLGSFLIIEAKKTDIIRK
jgi:SAM-dependent methyltransferase